MSVPMSAHGSPYACSKCDEARDTIYTCRDGGESVRVCPLGDQEKAGVSPCWWVAEGNPYGAGVGCICLISPEHWTARR